jgi:hypothetical protein
LAVELGCGIVGIAVFFFVVGFGLALLYGVVEVGLARVWREMRTRLRAAAEG